MRLIRQSENMPVKGIVCSEFIIRLKTAEMFMPNAAVKVRVGGKYDMQFCTHFISRISRKGGIVTINAFDRMRMTENDFIETDFKEEDQPFDTPGVLGAIASQCGFAPCSLSISAVPVLYYKDIHGKKCREILNLLSENAVGVWHCSDNEELIFTPLFSAYRKLSVDEKNSSPLYIHSRKGPFKAVYAKNTSSGEVFSAGSASDFRNILKLSGKLFDKDRTAAVMSGIAEKYFDSFYCAHAAVSFAPCGLTEFIFGDRYGLISVKSTVHFCAKEIFAEAATADICEDESDYTDLVGYELRKKIEYDRKYGSTIISDKGIGFTSDKCTDSGQADISFFTAVGNKVTEFGGAMLDCVMPDLIETITDGAGECERHITYGGKKYSLKYKKEKGKKTDISFTEVVE